MTDTCMVFVDLYQRGFLHDGAGRIHCPEPAGYAAVLVRVQDFWHVELCEQHALKARWPVDAVVDRRAAPGDQVRAIRMWSLPPDGAPLAELRSLAAT